MVTLASSTIRCIVRELGGPTPVETYDIEIDYGAVGDGVTDDSSAFVQFNTDNDTKTRTIRLYIPSGDYLLSTSDGRQFATDFDKIKILGETPSGGVWPSEITQTFAMMAGGPVYQDNLHSVRLEAITAGDSVITVKNEDVSGTGRTLAQLMALFSVGDWLLLTEYDTQGSGYPQNPIYSEYRKVVAKGVNTITLDTPTAFGYSDLSPVLEAGGASTLDLGGPATAYAIRQRFDVEAEVANLQINGGQQTTTSGRQVTIRNCKFLDNVAPSSAKLMQFIDCVLTSTEIDKIIERVEFTDTTISGNLDIQSSQPIEMIINGCTIATLNGTNLDFSATDTTFTTGTKFGPWGYGFALSASFTNCVFPSSVPTYTSRTYSVAGCTYTGSVIKGFAMAIGSRSGTPTVGQTLTGNGGATGTIAAIDSSNPSSWVLNLSSITGTFVDDEAVSTATMTGTNNGNIFGREWAGRGGLLVFGMANVSTVCSATMVDYYRDGQYLCVETDRSDWATINAYDDGPLTGVFNHQCPDLTMTGCTGNDVVVAWSQAPANFRLGEWSRFWLTSGGVLSSMPPVYGKVVSVTVNVTRAYTGTSPNLYVALSQFGVTGLRGPDYFYSTLNADRLNVRVDLKTTGTRVFSPSGNTGIQGTDVIDEMDFIIKSGFTPCLLTTSGGTTLAVISGESSSVWPEFTVTIVTEV